MTRSAASPDAAGLNELIGLYASPLALELYDEAVTELEHALQCAALAADEGASDSLVAAALLHDVGHFVVKDLVPITEELRHDAHHERAGAHYLTRWFGPEVTEPVRLHVEAKRYLCAVDATYHDGLSPSSVRSLAVQGGPMDADERSRFDALEGAEDAVRLRRWDDHGKVADLEVAPFAAWVPMIEGLVVS